MRHTTVLYSIWCVCRGKCCLVNNTPLCIRAKFSISALFYRIFYNDFTVIVANKGFLLLLFFAGGCAVHFTPKLNSNPDYMWVSFEQASMVSYYSQSTFPCHSKNQALWWLCSLLTFHVFYLFIYFATGQQIHCTDGKRTWGNTGTKYLGVHQWPNQRAEGSLWSRLWSSESHFLIFLSLRLLWYNLFQGLMSWCHAI